MEQFIYDFFPTTISDYRGSLTCLFLKFDPFLTRHGSDILNMFYSTDWVHWKKNNFWALKSLWQSNLALERDGKSIYICIVVYGTVYALYKIYIYIIDYRCTDTCPLMNFTHTNACFPFATVDHRPSIDRPKTTAIPACGVPEVIATERKSWRRIRFHDGQKKLWKSTNFADFLVIFRYLTKSLKRDICSFSFWAFTNIYPNDLTGRKAILGNTTRKPAAWKSCSQYGCVKWRLWPDAQRSSSGILPRWKKRQSSDGCRPKT